MKITWNLNYKTASALSSCLKNIDELEVVGFGTEQAAQELSKSIVERETPVSIYDGSTNFSLYHLLSYYSMNILNRKTF